jgi:hypothetical protein
LCKRNEQTQLYAFDMLAGDGEDHRATRPLAILWKRKNRILPDRSSIREQSVEVALRRDSGQPAGASWSAATSDDTAKLK